MRSRKKRARARRRQRALVMSGLAIVAAGAGAGLLRRVKRRGATSLARGDRGHEPKADTRREWSCPECGQALLVTGEGRHRVFWRPEAEIGDPLLDDRCPNCDAVLSVAA